MAQSFYFAGNIDAGVQSAERYLRERVGADAVGTPDLLVLRYGLFSVDDARKVAELAHRTPSRGEEKGIIIAAERLFHEAQNALLKVFEEPPKGTTLVLVIPSEGVLLATLRSRLQKLPEQSGINAAAHVGDEFIAATSATRAKIVEKVLARAKSDKQEEKQAARADALRIAESLLRACANEREKGSLPHATLAADLDRLVPILNDRSAPLKPILEHLLIATPAGLGRG